MFRAGRGQFTIGVAGYAATTINGEFAGMMMADPPDERVGRSVFSLVENGMVVMHLHPVPPGAALDLKAQLRALEYKGAPPSVRDLYLNAIEQAQKGGLLSVFFTALAQVSPAQAGKSSQHERHVYPLLATPNVVLSPPYAGEETLIPIDKAREILRIPSHIGHGETPIQLGTTPDGMAVFLDLGGQQTARHAAFVGQTRSGKSTAVKKLIDSILEKCPINIIVFDLKGEYAYFDPESGKYQSLFPEARVIGLDFGLPVGTLSINAKSHTAQSEAIQEALLVNTVLQQTMGRGYEGLEDLLLLAHREYQKLKSAAGNDYRQLAKHRKKVLDAVYRKIKERVGIPNNAPAEIILRGRMHQVAEVKPSSASPGGALPVGEKVTEEDPRLARAVICDLSWLTYGSDNQKAAFTWMLGGLMPAFGTALSRRTVICLEEIHLLPPQVLQTALRLFAGRGMSVFLVTQSPSDLNALGGAREQVSYCLYMRATPLQAAEVAQNLFGVADTPEYFPPIVKFDLEGQNLRYSYGVGALISPDGVRAVRVEVPNTFCKKMDFFNARGAVGQDGEDKDRA